MVECGSGYLDPGPGRQLPAPAVCESIIQKFTMRKQKQNREGGWPSCRRQQDYGGLQRQGSRVRVGWDEKVQEGGL